MKSLFLQVKSPFSYGFPYGFPFVFLWVSYVGNPELAGIGLSQPATNRLSLGFHSHGEIPIAGWFLLRENPTKMDDDWGYPYFRKPPYAHGFSIHHF